jgi:non-ribosomal peptide synthetase component F
MNAMPISRTVPRLVDELAQTHGEREAVVGSGRRLRYADLRDESLQVARVLHHLQVQPGDKIGS